MDDDDSILISSIRSQLDRLMYMTIFDMKCCVFRDSLDNDEYLEMKNETVEQLKVAIQNAISQAFKTPEIVAIFAKKEPALLRQKLMQVEAEHRLRKISNETYEAKKLEILHALYKLNDHLSDEERSIIEAASKISDFQFELASSHLSCDESIININL
uniref:Leucine zipper and CTNNBIP1 domain-containing protein n=1 Tax=Wuchereria bancrofti TaxID=6293 RepID=A0A1I8EDA1_WUCBA